jgi:acetylornithine/succinyldiaminopimelate/putrescine aminotransferase
VSCFAHGDQGGTFNGNPLMCAAGLAVLQHVAAPEFLKSVADTGRYWKASCSGSPRGIVSAKSVAAACCSRSI